MSCWVFLAKFEIAIHKLSVGLILKSMFVPELIVPELSLLLSPIMSLKIVALAVFS